MLWSQLQASQRALAVIPHDMEAFIQHEMLRVIRNSVGTQVKNELEPSLKGLNDGLSKLTTKQDLVPSTLGTRFAQLDEDLAWIGRHLATVQQQHAEQQYNPTAVGPRPKTKDEPTSRPPHLQIESTTAIRNRDDHSCQRLMSI